jgi:hypothetical protein
MILLDSDIVIDMLRGHPPALQWLATLGAEPIVVSGFVIMEVLDGCPDAAKQRRTEAEIRHYQVVWPGTVDCDHALALFRRFRLSHNLGLLDALIAQTAVSLGQPLHTFNVKHFAPFRA